MYSLNAASRACTTGLLLVVASGCDLRPTYVMPPTGELQLVVTSLSGAGVDLDLARVELSAVTTGGPPRVWGGRAIGVRTPITFRVLPGWYRAYASVIPQNYSPLRYTYRCETSGQNDSVNVAVDQRTVVQRAFICTAPGEVRVHTSVTGVEADRQLIVQIAPEGVACDLKVPEYPYYSNIPYTFIVPQIGAQTYGPVWPGTHRVNLCGLPESCPTAGTSQALVVWEDELTQVTFTIRCAAPTEQLLR